MKLKILMALIAVVIFCSCDKEKARHSLAPSEFSELIESTRKVRLQLPDSLSCNHEMRVRTDANHRLYVQLVSNYLIGVFDSTGRLMKVVGKQGLGPGESTRIVDFRVVDDGQIYVMDDLTDDMSLFDLRRGLIRTFPSTQKQVMTFDVYRNKVLFFRRAVVEQRSPHLVITSIAPDGQLTEPTEDFLDSGDESIRTRMLASQALSTNDEGVTVFAFMAAKVIYLLTADHHLSEINLDASSYKISKTRDLLAKYQEEKSKGFITEVFKNSRIISLGFISPEHILVSFATGVHEETKFYSQLYCLSTKEPFSRAYPTQTPVFYLGNYTFATWNDSIEVPVSHSNKSYELILYRFRSKL